MSQNPASRRRDDGLHRAMSQGGEKIELRSIRLVKKMGRRSPMRQGVYCYFCRVIDTSFDQPHAETERLGCEPRSQLDSGGLRKSNVGFCSQGIGADRAEST